MKLLTIRDYAHHNLGRGTILVPCHSDQTGPADSEAQRPPDESRARRSDANINSGVTQFRRRNRPPGHCDLKERWQLFKKLSVSFIISIQSGPH
jgi:hypothetical protein